MDTPDFRAAVGTALAAVGPLIEDKVVQHYVDAEVARRVPQIVKALDDLSKVEVERDKIKPTKVYDADKNQVGEQWTESQINQLNQAAGKVNKISDALNDALSKGDFTKLDKLAKPDQKDD